MGVSSKNGPQSSSGVPPWPRHLPGVATHDPRGLERSSAGRNGRNGVGMGQNDSRMISWYHVIPQFRIARIAHN